jgi:metallo-beta-lactamase class B
MTKKIFFLLVVFAPFHFCVFAQTVREPKATNTEWSEPFAPFRIVGNLYYVGTYHLACYLIATPDGNILINTGLAASLPIINTSIATLGFKLSDTRILLTTQAHFDHVGAMAALQKETGAKMFADADEADVLADGGSSDYEFGKNGRVFAPVRVDRTLKDQEAIEFGGTRLVMLHHPGHTRGSCSYLLEVKDANKTYKVLIANMPTIITDRKFDAIPAYPQIANDYAYTFGAMKKIAFDLWVASHAGQFNLHGKHKPGDAYNPEAFADRKGYNEELADLEESFRKKREEK